MLCGELVKQQGSYNCPKCQQVMSATSRFCPHCGMLMGNMEFPEDVMLSTGKHLRVAKDALDLRELLAVVEAGITWWKEHLHESEGVAREQAAVAIKNLSKVLDSLSQQLSQGRETVRITTRLPAQRAYSVGCPACGHGNRSGARFCQICGALLPESQAHGHLPSAARPSLRIASRSDVGRVRSNNEDTIYAGTLVETPGHKVTLLLVADGMGGAQAGEEASRLASSLVQERLLHTLRSHHPSSDTTWQHLLQETVQIANQRIFAQGQAYAGQQGMGTTLTALVCMEEQVHLAHVGDSRAYLLNEKGVTEDNARFMQLTTDHTLVARLVDIGHLTPEEARSFPQRNILYRALGSEAEVEVDTGSYALEAGDILLLCSDGLTSYVEDQELAHIVLTAADIQIACDQLVTLASRRGGRDNISVVMAKVEGMKC